MLKSLSFSILFIFALNASANDILYNRLDKLYDTDKKQCLVVVKRYIKYFQKQAVPFYYATLLYSEKSEKSRNEKGQYLHLRKAIGYAIQFEEIEDEELMHKVEWTNLKGELNSSINLLIDKLSASNDFALSERLSAKQSEFNHEYSNVATADISNNNAIVEVFNTSNSSKLFYGMPTGSEVILSSNKTGEQELLGYINAERKNLGMLPLEWEEGLAKASRYHSYDLGTQNYFNHSTYDRKNGKLVKIGGTFDRIKKFYSKSFVNSENIAAGSEKPYNTYMQWYNSKGHYENMFNPESTKIGIGTYYVEDSPFGYYWSMCTAL